MNLRKQWFFCIIAVIITVLFFSDWYGVSFFIISLSGNVTELSGMLEDFSGLMSIDTSQLTAITWISRSYYLIPITQIIYLILVLIGNRFSITAGKISAWLTFALSGLYLIALSALNGYLEEQMGSQLITLKAAPVCLLVLSLANGILFLLSTRQSGIFRRRN